MAVLLFFNELSCGYNATQQEADEAISEFVNMLRKINEWRSGTTLVSEVPFKKIEIIPGYYITQWGNKNANKDAWRRLQRFRDRAPFSSILSTEIANESEYFHDGQQGLGLAAAHLLNGLLVSFKLSPIWDRISIQAGRTLLVESESGELSLREEVVELIHAARCAHAGHHEEWIKQVGLTGLASGQEIWEARDDFYPALRFLPRVERDLRDLPPWWAQPVAMELRRINEAISLWKPDVSPSPAWHSYITPESQTRINKGYVDFEDLDGTVKTFSLHGRFTPLAGRIHFLLVPSNRTATIGYIGRKTGI
ncbi:hypothetical protein GCM10022252_08820 [Streptosporangium oxazolinicum]|uniref:Uncharacterized protein n=1 Tax=Streptosporangium oxazolinicum TaxID=909287 RepID=A0ABP8AEK5_9ACTN